MRRLPAQEQNEAGHPDLAQSEAALPSAGREKLYDCLFLALIVLWSFLLYAPRLGFYSDDWVFLELLHNADSGSFVDLVRSLHGGDRVIQQRPIQVLYLAGLYRLFGLNPAGYHWVNGCVFVANAMLFYLVLRRLQLPRLVALAAPVVYSLLPNYSSDRFWPAAFQAPVSITFFLLSLYCLLSAQLSSRRRAAWLMGCGLAVICSILAYEVTLPLILLIPLVAWFVGRRRAQASGGGYSPLSPPVLVASTLIPLAAATLFKLSVTVRTNVESNYLAHLLNVFTGAVRLNYVVYGLALPYIVWWILANAMDWNAVLASLVCGGAAALYLYRVLASSRAEGLPGTRFWLRLLAAGMVIFLLGYAIFIVSADITFESTSLANRVGIAAALGVALSFVAAAGFLSSLVARPRLSSAVFALLVAVLAAIGFLINNTLARFWEEAYVRQQAVLRDMNRQLDQPAAGSVVLLDGICLEHRGAYLFTGERDVESLLRIYYPDQDLEARALSHKPRAEAEGLVVYTHRDLTSFPYDGTLLIYNHDEDATYPIRTAEEAQAYLTSHPFDPDRDLSRRLRMGLGGEMRR